MQCAAPVAMDIRIRCIDDVNLAEEDRLVAHERVWARLDRYVGGVACAHFRLSDENGPRGGEDVRCVARLELRAGGVIIAHAIGRDGVEAVARAAAKAEAVVARRFEVRQAVRRPLRPARRTSRRTAARELGQ